MLIPLTSEKATPQILMWGDVETNGLNPYENNSLLQIAVFVTDSELNLLDNHGYEAFVKHDNVDAVYDVANDYVKEMHTENGIWDVLRTDVVKPLHQIDDELKDYIQSFNIPTPDVWWAGNSITLDRNFAEYFLPAFYNSMAHRSMDVTSVAWCARNWYGLGFEKKRTHNAKDDIMESIAELRAYREHIFR